VRSLERLGRKAWGEGCCAGRGCELGVGGRFRVSLCAGAGVAVCARLPHARGAAMCSSMLVVSAGRDCHRAGFRGGHGQSGVSRGLSSLSSRGRRRNGGPAREVAVVRRKPEISCGRRCADRTPLENRVQPMRPNRSAPAAERPLVPCCRPRCRRRLNARPRAMQEGVFAQAPGARGRRPRRLRARLVRLAAKLSHTRRAGVDVVDVEVACRQVSPAGSRRHGTYHHDTSRL
jgi:hypothetical protein